MSREIALLSPNAANSLPAAPEDLFHTGSALGAPALAAPPQVSPLKKVQRLLRGRMGLAITLGIIFAIAGGIGGWMAVKPQFISEGVIWIKPNIPSLTSADKVVPFYSY